MGLGSRSKRLRKNRTERRVNYYPKELKRLKNTLAFKWDEQQAKAHLSMFHDMMNGPPPAVPGLEEGSGLERLHLTQTNVSAERIERLLKRRMEDTVGSATLALDKEAAKLREAAKSKQSKPKEKSEVNRIYDPKTMKDQFGKYPSWLSQKARKKLAAEEREAKKILERRQRKIEMKKANSKNRKRKTTESADVEMQDISEDKAQEVAENDA